MNIEQMLRDTVESILADEQKEQKNEKVRNRIR